FLGPLREGRRPAISETGDDPGSQNALREHLDPAARPRPAVTAFVNIMQGCNHRCAFCVVPKTRGPERSRPLPEIVDECRQLIDRGVREITLLGQIVNRYGRHEMADIDGRSPFVQLLEAVDALDGLERLRFTAPHPDGYGADLVEAYARLPKLCESAHLPVQSGSDRILHLMRRGHTVEQFRSLVDQLRRVRPGIGLITDLIVGFPGETDADFEATLDLVRQVEFDQAYLFKYSHRPDTPAAAMPDQVPLGVREARHAELIKTVDEIAARRYQQFLGRHVQVLVEGPSRKNARRWTGRTRCHKIVLLEGSDRQLGQLIDVRITRTGRYTLYGDSAWIGMD
ncbi:MAG: MiaB/RimO family radical SAM methylthiotransferase, partial [Verrucomicrobia bacterium]|nr:MiaB/RimO family radical SAM methylthiotransferase [Verrucomicrobiota bacterium]